MAISNKIYTHSLLVLALDAIKLNVILCSSYKQFAYQL